MHGTIYRHIRLLAMLFAAFMPALIGCSSSDEVSPEDGPDSPQEIAIGFRLEAPSRAVDLSTVYDDFCVRAVKAYADGTKSLVIPDYLVRYIDGKWIYSGETNKDGSTQFLKYWDLSVGSYTFAAVAPASSAGATFSIDDNGMFTFTLADLSTDWKIARTIRRGVTDASILLDYDDIAEDIEEIDNSATKTSAVFPTPYAPYADVPLNFHSILAKVVIKAYADNETEFVPLEVGFNNIGIAPATYNSATGWTTTPLHHQPLYYKDTLITSEHNSRETALPLTELFVIPQQRTDAANNSLVQINVKTDNNDDSVRNLTLPCPWEPNNTYIYYLKFEGGDSDQIILMDVAVEPMTKGGEAENEQHNW